jgi:CheY-like chemotaxis protein
MTLTKAVKANTWPGSGILIQKSMKTHSNILVIDDDDIFIFLTRKMLQSTGMVESITVCRSATEAIELLHTMDGNWPDVILLDLNMPEMNGWEFLQQYQLLVKHVKTPPRLYVVSSSIADNDTERAKKIKGVDGYIAKPLTNDRIIGMIRETMAS